MPCSHSLRKVRHLSGPDDLVITVVGITRSGKVGHPRTVWAVTGEMHGQAFDIHVPFTKVSEDDEQWFERVVGGMFEQLVVKFHPEGEQALELIEKIEVAGREDVAGEIERSEASEYGTVKAMAAEVSGTIYVVKYVEVSNLAGVAASITQPDILDGLNAFSNLLAHLVRGYSREKLIENIDQFLELYNLVSPLTNNQANALLEDLTAEIRDLRALATEDKMDREELEPKLSRLRELGNRFLYAYLDGLGGELGKRTADVFWKLMAFGAFYLLFSL